MTSATYLLTYFLTYLLTIVEQAVETNANKLQLRNRYIRVDLSAQQKPKMRVK